MLLLTTRGSQLLSRGKLQANEYKIIQNETEMWDEPIELKENHDFQHHTSSFVSWIRCTNTVKEGV